mgnify:CR=1 FL=1
MGMHRTKVEYAKGGDVHISVAIAEAITDVSEGDVTDVGPLYETVDTDAIEQLFCEGEVPDTTELRFPVGEYQVSVHGSGTIEVERFE